MQKLNFSKIQWLLLLLLSVIAIGINVLYFVNRARKYAPTPDSDPGPMIIGAMCIWVLPLFLLTIIGVSFGWSGLFNGFPGQNPARLFDWLCFVFALCSLLRGTIWVFFQGGAEFLTQYHLLDTLTESQLEVEIWWLAAVTGSIAGWIVLLLKTPKQSSE